MSDSIKILASGDSFTTRRIPNNYPGRAELQRLIEAHDVSFNNLEMTYHYAEGAPAAFSGGTWAMADPTILDDMNALGFNLYNTANNHSMDYGPDGLMATVRHLKERDMPFSGTGGNLYDFSRRNKKPFILRLHSDKTEPPLARPVVWLIAVPSPEGAVIASPIFFAGVLVLQPG